MKTDFDAHSWVRDALNASTIADPSVIAAELADSIDSRLVREALRQTLPAFVSGIVTRGRASHLGNQTACDESKHGASPRWDAVRSIFTERIFTSDGWKMLRDCTRDDLLAAAQERYDRAARLTAWGDKYAKLADLLDAQDAAKVGDLSEDEVRAVFA